jgi:ABC-type antimicrobial peptide transport system permease subunit
MVVIEGLKPALLGVAIGLVSALALGRLMNALVFGVTPHDVATLSAVSVILTMCAAMATLVPAYRATRVDPVVALRDEP